MARRLLVPLIAASVALGYVRVIGQQAGLYDTAFGSAARTLIEIAFITAVVSWAAQGLAQAHRAMLMAQAAARERDQRLLGILEIATDGFLAIDADWRFTYANREAERLCMLEREQMLGRSLWEVFPAVAGTPLEHNYRKAMRDRVAIDLEHFYEPFGRWYSLRIHPMPEGGLSVFFQDINDRKEAERALAEMRKDAGGR